VSTGEEQAATRAGAKRTVAAVGVGWRVYQQVAAIIGSFALLAFLTNFVHFDWRGWLETLIGMWGQYVRPPVRWLLHYTIEMPLGWVGWHVHLPAWLHDYLAAGFVLAASVLRTFSAEDGWRQAVRDFFLPPKGGDRRGWDSWLGWFPVFVLVWPVVAAVMLLGLVVILADLASKYEKDTDRNKRDLVLGILFTAPMFYAGALLALNYVVLH
jgi:hypothetical protein